MTRTDSAAIANADETRASTAWKEVVASDEQERFKGFADKIIEQQRRVAAEGKVPKPHPRRGFHAKPHAGLKAEFKVMPNLPEYARQGVFSEPGKTFHALVRFSNGKPEFQSDRRREPRGIAIKLIGVAGRKLLPGREDEVTQDFLATSHSVTSAVRNVDQFMAFVEAQAESPFFFIGPLARKIHFCEAARITFALFRTVLLSCVRSMVTEKYSSTAPIKFGPYAVKFTVQPAAETAPTKWRWPTKDFLSKDIAGRLGEAEILLDFLVQFYVCDRRTPIEDTSVVWDSPPLKVAQLHIFKNNVNDKGDLDQQLTDRVDGLSFNPWHAIEDHRPLGNVMRARRVAYEASANLRNHSPEPRAVPLAVAVKLPAPLAPGAATH
jgi:hypothetical protein